MNTTVLTVLVLWLLLLSLIAPFSGLATLMSLIFVVATGWAIWKLVQTLMWGANRQDDH